MSAAVVAELAGDRTRCTTLRSDPPISLRDTPDGLYLVASGAGPVGGDDLHLDAAADRTTSDAPDVTSTSRRRSSPPTGPAPLATR